MCIHLGGLTSHRIHWGRLVSSRLRSIIEWHGFRELNRLTISLSHLILIKRYTHSVLLIGAILIRNSNLWCNLLVLENLWIPSNWSRDVSLLQSQVFCVNMNLVLCWWNLASQSHTLVSEFNFKLIQSSKHFARVGWRQMLGYSHIFRDERLLLFLNTLI